MQDDPIPFASAPGPVAAPDAAPVTLAGGSGPSGGPTPRRSRTTVVLVAAILVFDLLVAAGVWFYLNPGSVPVSVSASAGVESALRSRVATEYPDFTVTGVSSRQVDYSTAAGGGSEWVFYFEMQSIERPAFAFTARYYTLVSSKADPRCYANGDSFFNPRLTPPEIASSFMRMWLFSHPGEKCLYVTLGDGWGSAARTCEVSYARFERTGTSVTSTSGAYVFNYLPDTDTWTQVAAAASPAPQEDAAVGYEFSLADTRTAVVNALPGFEAIGTATRANGDPMILVRHTKYRGLRMAVDGVFLDPPNTTLDMVDLFIGDRVKADSFARAWSSAHGGTIIDLLYFEDAGTKNTLGMTFVTSVKDVDDTRHEESTQYHYDSKTHVWTEMK